MPRLHISKFGEINEGFIQWVKNTLSECYKKIDSGMVELVEVCLFEKERYARVYLKEEKKRLGIGTELDEAFLTAHDAWTGIPRISICEETLNETSPEVRIGALHHEAAHSILHGSLEFYVVSFPPELRDLANKFCLPPAFMEGIMYLASVAVKDYEVTKILYDKGFIDDQIAFANHFLQPSDEEVSGWIIASNSPITTILFLTSLMKCIACALPLIDDEMRGNQISSSVSSYINYLPEEHKKTLLGVMKVYKNFTGRFHDDLRILLREIIKTLQTSIMTNVHSFP